ncbi:MAG: tRNA 2-thiouridine(34) synthase MnmA [Firmicutes bacterium]|nr:tRNA 2-thiouridine(34) synthase MnmA [Bacillota bacterium]
MGSSVLTGLSGGVDSTASVILLQQQGYQVSALYFDTTKGGSEEARTRAQECARRLQIPFYAVNKAEEFEEKIIGYFCDSYCKGETPCPCVVCNPSFKLKTLLAAADAQGIDYIATGHYAGIYRDEDGVFYVKKAANRKKDQSYMLCRVPQQILSRILFPLSGFENKDQVRSLAAENAMPSAATKDSQDLCFLKGDYKDFLKERGITGKPGLMKLSDGTVIKSHGGIAAFTIGQRKGLGIAVGRPVFVSSIDEKTGDVIMDDEAVLFQKEVCLGDLFFAKYGSVTTVPAEYEGKTFQCKLRYTAREAEGLLTGIGDGRAKLSFADGQRAPTPGQFAVFYQNDLLIGSGVIQ